MRCIQVRKQIVSSCPLCRSGHWTPVLEGEDFDTGSGSYQICCCAECGLKFTNPCPIAADLPLLYEDREFESMPTSTPLSRLRAARLARRVRRLRPHFPQGQLACADLGTGDGFFATVVANEPFCKRMLAVDLFEVPPPLLARQGGFVEYASFDRTYASSEKFDVVFARFVLEHVHDPHDFARRVGALLNPGGALVIEVPNWNSRWRTMLGRYYSELSLPAHTLHFEPATLTRLLLDWHDVRIFEDQHGMVLGKSLGNWLGRPVQRTGPLTLALLPLELAVDLIGPPPNMTAIARKTASS